MSHITKQFFEGHPTCQLFEETATFLGINIDDWAFADGTENTLDGVEYITVIYESENEPYNLGAVFVLEDGEWQVQTFRNELK